MHEGHVSCPSMDLQLVYFWKTLYILEAILLVHKRTVSCGVGLPSLLFNAGAITTSTVKKETQLAKTAVIWDLLEENSYKTGCLPA